MTQGLPRWIGDDAIGIDTDCRDLRNALCEALIGSGRWIEVVPGKRDIVVRFDPLEMDHEKASALLMRQAAETRPLATSTRSTLHLTMDCDPKNAPDLASLCEANGLKPDAFLEILSRSPLVVDMLGFMPGFAYVDGLDPALRAERLGSPRSRLPAGSVGILTGQVGLYALSGPGGWPIIGRIREPLFSPEGRAPALLSPGTRLRISVGSGPCF